MGIKCFQGVEVLSFCDSVTLWLCHSVHNKQSNYSAAFHPFGPTFFAPIWAKNYVSKKSTWPRTSWAGAGGQKKWLLKLSQPFHMIYVCKSKRGSKITKLNKGISLNNLTCWPWANWPKLTLPIIARSKFLNQTDPIFFLYFQFTMINFFLTSPHLAGWQACV